MKKKISGISAEELLRDQAIYRKLSRKLSFTEKVRLMSNISNYHNYRRVLFILARKHGIDVLPVD